MAKCLYCGKKGLFLSVSTNGLCNSCEPAVVLSITSLIRVLNDCIRLVDTSKNADVRLSRLRVLLNTAQELAKYEHLGIPTTRPLPSEYLLQYRNRYVPILVEYVDAAIEKIKKAGTQSSRQKKVNEALQEIKEAKTLLEDNMHSSFLNDLESNLKSLGGKQPVAGVQPVKLPTIKELGTDYTPLTEAVKLLQVLCLGLAT